MNPIDTRVENFHILHSLWAEFIAISIVGFGKWERKKSTI